MMNRIGYITAILLAVLLCGSCINEEYAGPDPDLPTRTIIVYLGGDNNLSEETGRKIEALRQGWTYTGNKCLIYQDSRDGARLLRLRGGCRTTPTPYVETVREYGAENSASAETFARVLREVAAEYPADSYGLIFFSHASGWLPAGALQNPAPRSRSVGVDDGDAGRAEMDIAEFAAAIPGGMFDFIVFETCLTAGVEDVYKRQLPSLFAARPRRSRRSFPMPRPRPAIRWTAPIPEPGCWNSMSSTAPPKFPSRARSPFP